jgi:hypothetical protein
MPPAIFRFNGPGSHPGAFMVPTAVKALFWDTDIDAFSPREYPDYAIFRVLEYGDKPAVAWMRQTFSESEIRRVLATERRLTPKSATFWALVYGLPAEEVAALNGAQRLRDPRWPKMNDPAGTRR